MVDAQRNALADWLTSLDASRGALERALDTQRAEAARLNAAVAVPLPHVDMSVLMMAMQSAAAKGVRLPTTGLLTTPPSLREIDMAPPAANGSEYVASAVSVGEQEPELAEPHQHTDPTVLAAPVSDDGEHVGASELDEPDLTQGSNDLEIEDVEPYYGPINGLTAVEAMMQNADEDEGVLEAEAGAAATDPSVQAVYTRRPTSLLEAYTA